MTTDGRKTLLPYLRQSRGKDGEDEETSLSLNQQEESIKDWGERNGYTVLRAIRDHDETGRTMQRPGFEQLKASAKDGIAIGVYKYDRFARNLIGQEQAVAELEAAGATVVSITEPPGKLPRQIMGSISEYYSDQLSERLIAIRGASARAGRYIGTVPPYGYQRAGTIPVYDRATGAMRDRPSGPLVIVPGQAAIVRELFVRVRDGEAMHPLTRDLLNRGIRTVKGYAFTATTLRKLLRNPIYMGKTTHKGKIAGDGLHEAIVEAALWTAVQDRIDRNPRLRVKSPNTESSWAEGYVRHECGARMYHTIFSHRSRAGEIKPYTVFACRYANGLDKCGIKHMVVKADKIERAIRRGLAHDLATVGTVAQAIAIAEQEAGGLDVTTARSDLERQRIRADDRLARAREEWLDGGDDRDAWEAEKVRHRELVAALDATLAALPVAPDPDRFASAHATIESVSALIADMAGDTLRLVLDAVGTGVVGPAGITIRYRAPFDAFVRAPLIIGW